MGIKEKLSKISWPYLIRGPRLYEYFEGPAQGVKILLQMIVGVTGSFVVLVSMLRDVIHGGMSATDVAHHVLALIAASLAVAASLELAYTLFTPGPDEAIDPLMLGVSAVFLYLVSKLEDLTWTGGVSAILFAATLAILFGIRRHFIDESDVREGQSGRLAALEHEVRQTMGEPQAKTALDLLFIAEFGWHDRYRDIGIPEKIRHEILQGSRQQLDDMIALIKAKLEDKDQSIKQDESGPGASEVSPQGQSI